MALARENISYTYADFLEWDESDRCELVDGEVFMFAAPSTGLPDRSGGGFCGKSCGLMEIDAIFFNNY
jgi:hypothetical protein